MTCHQGARFEFVEMGGHMVLWKAREFGDLVDAARAGGINGQGVVGQVVDAVVASVIDHERTLDLFDVEVSRACFPAVAGALCGRDVFWHTDRERSEPCFRPRTGPLVAHQKPHSPIPASRSTSSRQYTIDIEAPELSSHSS